MEEKITGRVLKFGDNINTDIISPPAYMELSMEEVAKYAMSPVDPEFAATARPGDIFVAENNLGILAIECPDTDKISKFDEISVDTQSGIIRNLTTGAEYHCDKIPPHIMELVSCGGLVESLKHKLNR
ncbi:hypothetical protein [Flavonifractor sp. HCP28S3_F3]|uniref:hypothetical protein n=1 Tax=Flavonifractor sp. HCP28S3_F3 TaxID=3438939 RepID=UPI003F8B3529